MAEKPTIDWQALKCLATRKAPVAPYPVKVETVEGGLIWTFNEGERVLITDVLGFPVKKIYENAAEVLCPITLARVGYRSPEMMAEMRNALTRAGVRNLPIIAGGIQPHYLTEKHVLFHAWLVDIGGALTLPPKARGEQLIDLREVQSALEAEAMEKDQKKRAMREQTCSCDGEVCDFFPY